MILLVFGVPFNPGNPVVCHTVDQLSAALPEHRQILQHRAQSPGAQGSRWHQGEEPAHLCEVEVVLKGQGDVSVYVNLLLSIDIIWTHLPPRQRALPGEL